VSEIQAQHQQGFCEVVLGEEGGDDICECLACDLVAVDDLFPGTRFFDVTVLNEVCRFGLEIEV
jgi:hypothetical protein